MTTVNFNDLDMAMEFVSSGGIIEARAFVSLDSGKIYWESTDLGDDLEALPDDIDDLDKYTEVPSKFELDLGKDLVFRFVGSQLPDSYDDVEAIFRRRGAYGRFKDLLAEAGKLETWYQYEEEAQKKALCNWAEAEGFTVAFPDGASRQE